jgi:hypothetical protein
VGARGKEAAEEDRRVATAKVERLAAEASPARASEILDQVDRDAAEGYVGRPGGRI